MSGSKQPDLHSAAPLTGLLQIVGGTPTHGTSCLALALKACSLRAAGEGPSTPAGEGSSKGAKGTKGA
eukprot:5385046-Heterocapsa_arctica.AAC.1